MSQAAAAPSAIDRVEVFRFQAVVTRRVELAAASSPAEILRVSGLPLKLLDESVRVRVQGGGPRVLDLRVEWDVSSADRPLRTEAEAEVRRLERELCRLRLETIHVSEGLHQVEVLQPSLVGGTELPESLAFKPISPLPAWLKLAKWARSEGHGAREGLRRIDKESRNLREQLSEAYDRLAKASAAEGAELTHIHKAVRLNLEGCTPGQPLSLELSYLVPGAAWVPEYELRVREDVAEAELVLRALVAQRSGEDWVEAGFSFSTADLARSTELPELDSWRIGRAQPRKRSGWRDLPDSLGELFTGYDADLRPLPPAPAVELPELPEMPRLDLESDPGSPRYGGGHRRKATLGGASGGRMLADDDSYEEEEYQCFREETPSVCAEMSMDYAPSAPPPASAFRMAASAPMPAAPRMSAPREKMKRRAQDAPGGGGPAPLEEPLVETELQASRAALGFDSLRLHGPGDGRTRGQLKAVSLREELASALGDDSVPEDIVDIVRASQAQGLEVRWPAHTVPVRISAGHFAARYPMEGRGSLPADGQLRALTLVRHLGRVARVFRVVPRVDPAAYQVAIFDNPLGTPLLAGPVSVFRGGDFVVTASLPTTAPNGPLSVNLGVEPGIKVARNTHFEEQTGGLFGGGTEANHRIEIEVRSKLAFPARVEVFERVPMSHTDTIKVEVLRSEPQAERYDQRERRQIIEGGLKFTLDLAPGEVRTCVLEYRVSLPSKRVLDGGNRRD